MESVAVFSLAFSFFFRIERKLKSKHLPVEKLEEWK